MRTALMIGVVCVLFGQALGAQAQPAPATAPPQIVTSAVGEARVQPDRATIVFAVETRATSAAQAGAENSRRQRAVLDTLRKLGLTQNEVSTVGYSVSPDIRHDRNEPRVVGYVARNMVQADVRRIEQVGMLIDAALAAGANVVNSLRFFSSRADEGRRAALADAVAKARTEAEVLARAAGGSLGPLLELTTSGPIRPMYEDVAVMARAASDAPTPINPGEQTMSAMVTARWTFVSGSR